MAKEEAVAAAQGTMADALGALYDAGKADGIAQAGGGEDTTPYSQAQMDEVTNHLSAVQAELDAMKAEEPKQLEAIASAKSKIDQVLAILEPKDPATTDPAV